MLGPAFPWITRITSITTIGIAICMLNKRKLAYQSSISEVGELVLTTKWVRKNYESLVAPNRSEKSRCMENRLCCPAQIGLLPKGLHRGIRASQEPADPEEHLPGKLAWHRASLLGFHGITWSPYP